MSWPVEHSGIRCYLKIREWQRLPTSNYKGPKKTIALWEGESSDRAVHKTTRKQAGDATFNVESNDHEANLKGYSVPPKVSTSLHKAETSRSITVIQFSKRNAIFTCSFSVSRYVVKLRPTGIPMIVLGAQASKLLHADFFAIHNAFFTSSTVSKIMRTTLF